MAEGKRAEHWNFFAPLIAVIANGNRDPKKSKAIKVEDIHPYLGAAARAKSSKKTMGEFFAMAKSAFQSQTMPLSTFRNRP